MSKRRTRLDQFHPRHLFDQEDVRRATVNCRSSIDARVMVDGMAVPMLELGGPEPARPEPRPRHEYILVNDAAHQHRNVGNVQLPWDDARRFVEVMEDGRHRVFDLQQVAYGARIMEYVGTVNARPQEQQQRPREEF